MNQTTAIKQPKLTDEDANNVRLAVLVAQEQGANKRQKATTDPNNPLYGGLYFGNTMVLWKPEDKSFTRLNKQGILELGGEVFYYRCIDTIDLKNL